MKKGVPLRTDANSGSYSASSDSPSASVTASSGEAANDCIIPGVEPVPKGNTQGLAARETSDDFLYATHLAVDHIMGEHEGEDPAAMLELDSDLAETLIAA